MNAKKYGKFTVDTQIPSYNEYINKCRGNKYNANSFKQNIEKIAGKYINEACNRGELPVFDDTPCIIRFTWYESKANRDADNIQAGKTSIIDALRTSKIIKNDGQKYVRQTFHRVLRSDNGKTYVVVELLEYNPIEDIAVI